MTTENNPESFPDDEPRAASGRHSQVTSERVEVGSAHIDVSQAEIVQSQESRQQSKYLAYSLCVLFVFMCGIGLANLLFTNSQVHQVQANSSGLEQANARLNRQLLAIAVTNARLSRQITGDCSFYQDLSGLPLSSMPNGHPSELGVKIISDSRAAWAGHGCPGQLPPPDPSFVAGAKYYHLPVH